jgi:hypothetical protein
MAELSKDEIIKSALEDGATARAKFMAKHGTHARKVATKLADFYTAFGDALPMWPKTNRCRTVGQFVHVAGNSLVQSLSLLVAGMGAPSGNLMRHYAEALAMALLCTVEETGVLERYLGNRRTYPIHKALDRLTQEKTAKLLATRVGFDGKAWSRFKHMMSLFDHHSHSGIVTVGYHQRLGKKTGGIIIGTAYDSHKFAIYRHELKFRAAAASHLKHILHVLDPLMRGT